MVDTHAHATAGPPETVGGKGETACRTVPGRTRWACRRSGPATAQKRDTACRAMVCRCQRRSPGRCRTRCRRTAHCGRSIRRRSGQWTNGTSGRRCFQARSALLPAGWPTSARAPRVVRAPRPVERMSAFAPAVRFVPSRSGPGWGGYVANNSDRALAIVDRVAFAIGDRRRPSVKRGVVRRDAVQRTASARLWVINEPDHAGLSPVVRLKFNNHPVAHPQTRRRCRSCKRLARWPSWWTDSRPAAARLTSLRPASTVHLSAFWC